LLKTDIYLIVLSVVTFCLLVLTFFISRIKLKKQINVSFIILVACMLVCNFGYIIAIVCETYYGIIGIELAYLPFIGEILLPVAFLFVGLIFAKNKIRLNRNYLLLLVIPAITIIILLTNSLHRLFFYEYRMFSDIKYGLLFLYIHLPWTYGCVTMGLFYFIRFSIKNAGFFSKQAILIFFGSLLPFALNIVWVIGNATNNDMLKLYSEYDMLPISFSFAILCFAFAIFKFDFLNVVPIALQRIVDIMPDSFVVIDDEYNIIDFNKTLIDTFGQFFQIKRKASIVDVLNENTTLNISADNFISYIKKAVDAGEAISYEHHFTGEDFDKYFVIEIIPMFIENKKGHGNRPEKIVKLKERASLIGTIILLKDITEHKKNIEAIKEHQAILLEQERLASLGQLIGGIAHNLKTPIMSISGGIEALRDLAFEYRDSIGDKSVTEQDHKEIALEMLSWLDKMKPYCTYMSDVISAVKGQAVQMIASGTEKFTVNEVVKKVDLLLRHELKRNHCILKIDSNVDMSTEIKGEVNNLIQVFDNIIINSIQAYEGKGGVIELGIVRSGDNVEFTFKDYGKGIPKRVTEKLFKEMITTKGKNGTGLGLYMSYSTIKGRFGGNISFTTKEGSGTTFFISVPCITYNKQEA
jgi:two-component system sensor histidine kinase HupT/HoxJ